MSDERFMICPYDPGAATVKDRQSGERVGAILQNFHGRWTPIRDGLELAEPTSRHLAALHVWETRGAPPRNQEDA